MNASPQCHAVIKHFEECVLKAYADPKTKGPPYTCGWGCTRGVTPTTVWTQEKADAELLVDVHEAEELVDRFVTHPMTQGQYDAFVSIFYNVGEGRPDRPGHDGRDGIAFLRDGRPSTLLRKFNAGDIGGAETEWLKWISPGSRVENGLKRRRMAELALFRGETPDLTLH